MKHAVLVPLLLGTAACSGEGAPVAAARAEAPREDVVVRGDLTERVVLAGTIKSVKSAELVSPRTRVWQLSIRWLADDGAVVKAGDKVLEFDNSAFAAELEEKKLRLEQASLDLQNQHTVNAMAIADAELEQEKQRVLLERARLWASVPKDLLPERDWQERQLALERAKVAYEKAAAQVATVEQTAALDLKVKQIEHDKAKRELAATEEGIAALTLSAPRGGVLVVGEHPWMNRKFQVGDTVQPGWTIVELPELDDMQVEAWLSDVDDGKVLVGMEATCTLDAYPETPFPARVEKISPVANEISEQSLRRAFRVTLDLAETDADKMRPGMSVKVDISGRTETDRLLAPRGALAFDGDEPVATLASGERVPVRVGLCDAHRCVVEEGLAEGTRLWVGGSL